MLETERKTYAKDVFKLTTKLIELQSKVETIPKLHKEN